MGTFSNSAEKNTGNAATSILAIALVALAALACANVPNSNRRSGNSTTTPSTSTTGNSAVETSWSYTETEDQMGNGRIYLASIRSSNTISLDFPYDGEQRGTLALRHHPQHGKDVYLKIERGQLLDSDYNDPVIVRFDTDKSMSFSSTGPSDHSTETLFLGGNAFALFSKRLKTAKTLRIQAPIYQGGNQVFIFDVQGFTWKFPS